MIALEATGLPGVRLAIVGVEETKSPVVRVATDDLREVRVIVTVPAAEVAKLRTPSVEFSLTARDAALPAGISRRTSFQMPAPAGVRTP